MTSPAEFLRYLDQTATPRPWGTKASIVWIEPQPGSERHETFEANGQCATVLRNLLPELAAVVEAAEKRRQAQEQWGHGPMKEFVDREETFFGALDKENAALDALTAAIAREQSR